MISVSGGSSPLARGTLPNNRLDPLANRLIPARAGNIGVTIRTIRSD